MTHSGGKEHQVGDRGQRYEVSFFNPTTNARQVYGWTDDLDAALAMSDCVEKHPSWQFGWLTDRRAVVLPHPSDVRLPQSSGEPEMNEEKMRKEFEYWYRSPANTDLTSKLAWLSWQAACAIKQEEIDNWKIVAEDWRVKAVEWSRKNDMEGMK